MNSSKQKRNMSRSMLIKERSQLAQTPRYPFIEVDMRVCHSGEPQAATKQNMATIAHIYGFIFKMKY